MPLGQMLKVKTLFVRSPCTNPTHLFTSTRSSDYGRSHLLCTRSSVFLQPSNIDKHYTLIGMWISGMGDAIAEEVVSRSSYRGVIGAIGNVRA
jgi:hypothetical protein